MSTEQQRSSIDDLDQWWEAVHPVSYSPMRLNPRRLSHNAVLANSNIRNGFKVIIPPPCTCQQCREQWHALVDQKRHHTHADKAVHYAKIYDYDEAGSELQALRDAIMTDLCDLRQSLARQGDDILKQWSKKSSVAKRASLLREAMPFMAETMFWREEEQAKQEWKTRDALRPYQVRLLLPYLSIEDFSQHPQKLLLLLHLRCIYEPWDWAAVDQTQTAFGWYHDHFEVGYNDRAVGMMAKDYGHPVLLDLEKAHRWEMCGFPRALLILQAQKTLMSMLRNIVDKLVGQREGLIGNEKWRVFAGRGLRDEGRNELASPYLNAAFVAPPSLDAAALAQTAQVRLDVAQDHVWLPQTDPAYMHRTFTNAFASFSFQNVDKLMGKPNEKFERLATYLTLDDMVVAARWQTVGAQCSKVQDAIQRACSAQGNQRQAQSELTAMLQDLYNILVMEMCEQTSLWTLVLQDLNLFDQKKRIVHRGGKRISQVTMAFKDPVNADLYDRVLCALVHIGRISDTLFDHRAEEFDYEVARDLFIIDYYLERARSVQSTPKTVRHLNDKALIFLADLAAIQALLVDVRSHRPGFPLSPRTWTQKDVDRHFDANPGTKFNENDNKKLGQLLRAFYELPKPTGYKDQAWLSRRDAQLQAMDDFWTFAESVFWCRSNHSSNLAKRMRTLFQMRHDTEHKQALEDERTHIMRGWGISSRQPDVKYIVPVIPAQDSDATRSHLKRTTDKSKTRPRTWSPTNLE